MKILYALVTLCAAATVYAAGGIGEDCTAASDCTDKDAECNASKKCSCPVNTFLDHNSCVAKRNVEEDCNNDNECIDTLECNTKCSCKNTELWNDISCVGKAGALEAAYCDSNGACKEAGYNSSSPCDMYRHRCDCAQFYKRDGATCKKRPEYERKCTRNEDCTASGYKKSCNPTNQNCLCDQDYMSNGTICVHKPTPPSAYCNKNEDCKDSNYTSSCVIDDHRCSCAPGYKIQGFSCVKSDGVAILGSAMLAILTALLSQLC